VKRILQFSALLLLCPLLACQQEPPVSPLDRSPDAADRAVDPALAAGELMLAFGWDFDPDVQLPASLAALGDKCGPGIVVDFQREAITGDIAHYGIVLAVGPGEHDVIGLHRVVRESRPFTPIRARKSLFLVHGMGKDFVGNFLPGVKSPLLPDDFGFAVFMAQNGLDVWGVDNSYTLVPAGLEDFSFAAGWGMDKCVADIATGVAVARSVRLFTGNGWRKMVLVGYSQGAIMGYAYLDGEADLPPVRRSISAFVPVDWGLGYDDPDVQQGECEFLGGYVGLYGDGVYGFDDDPDGFYASLGQLAQTDPDGPSPYYDGFTNLQVFLFFTATATPPNTVHYWAAIFDEFGVPLDLVHTTRLMATEFWIHWAPMHPPTHLWADFYAINCEDSVWEANLAAIDLPVFSLEAAGGGGPGMAGTLDRLVGCDVTRHVVQLLGPDDVLLDFGHVDLFTAENAAALAWQPTLDWLSSLHGQAADDAPDLDLVLDQAALPALRALGGTMAPSGRYLAATASAPMVAPPAAPARARADLERDARLRQTARR